MVAPALLPTTLSAGTHTVTFRYTGYGSYPQLLTLSAITLLAIAAGERVTRPAGRSSLTRGAASADPLARRKPGEDAALACEVRLVGVADFDRPGGDIGD